MAATVEARRLTEAHRIAQARLGSAVAARLVATWRLLDPDDLDRTIERWLAVNVPLVQASRRTSARLSANYLTAFRTLEIGVDGRRFSAVLAEDIGVEQITTSLLVTGPASIRSGLARGRPLDQVLDAAKVRSAGAAMRHALNGARDTILGTVNADQTALGWSRATSGKPCAFCAMLASRGPVYRSESTADFHPHDHCSCQPEPVYRRDADWPPGARDYRELWNTSTSGHSGRDAINAFRRALG